MSVEESTRHKYIAFSYLILAMVLFFAFSAVLWMTKLKHDINHNESTDDDIMGWVLTIVTTIVTLIINFILGAIMRYLT